MAVPATPTNFYLQQGNGQTFLSWDLTSTATSYKVQRSTDGVSYSLLASPSPNYYLDSSVTVGTIYYYKVAAHNSDGDSAAYTTAQSIVPTQTGDLSLGMLRLLSQQRADRVGSNFVSLPEWNSYINQSYFELYDLLVTLFEDYYVAPAVQFSTTGVASYALPNGVNYTAAPAFYKLLGVDCGTSPNGFVTLRKFDFIQRNRYVYPTMGSSIVGPYNGLQYRLLGSNIEFIPTPSSGLTIQLWYVPKLSMLLQDTDIASGVSGWLEYVIVDAAIKALQKEESDVQVLMAQKMALKQRIEETAQNRDAGAPDTISDTRGSAGSFGPNGDGPFGGW